MKRKVNLLVIAIFLSTFLQAQQLLTKGQQEVQKALIRMFDHVSKRDSVSLKMDCTENVTFYEYGQVWTIDTLINKAITLNISADFTRTNAFDFINTEAGKNTAWVTYRLNSDIMNDGKEISIQWLETAVLVKQKKQWKVKHLHSTLLKRN